MAVVAVCCPWSSGSWISRLSIAAASIYSRTCEPGYLPRDGAANHPLPTDGPLKGRNKPGCSRLVADATAHGERVPPKFVWLENTAHLAALWTCSYVERFLRPYRQSESAWQPSSDPRRPPGSLLDRRASADRPIHWLGCRRWARPLGVDACPGGPTKYLAS